jgi:hypothetical protein
MEKSVFLERNRSPAEFFLPEFFLPEFFLQYILREAGVALDVRGFVMELTEHLLMKKNLCALCVLCELYEKCSLIKREIQLYKTGSRNAHKVHKAHEKNS